jgi:hypothetical protein
MYAFPSSLNVLGFNQTVTKDSDLYQRLIVNSEPILFVGESPNRSHTLAFATMRGSLEGILSTSLNASHLCTRELLLKMLEKQQLRAFSQEEGGLSAMYDCTFQIYILPAPHSTAAKFDAFKEFADKLEGNSDHFLRQVFCNADAAKLEQFVESRGEKPAEVKNIWFQCPWQEQNSNGSTDGLLCNFFKSASTIQNIGDFVYIGIFNESFHRHYKYYLSSVVGAAKACGYERVGEADTGLISECYKFGYRPYSQFPGCNLDRYKDLLVTHVFTRT